LQRPTALAIALTIAVFVLPALAHAETVTASNADALRYIIYSANTTYSIAAEGDKIAVTNTDVNHTLLLVFNPALRITLFNVSGAHAVLVNSTDYSVVEDILGNATSYDIVSYGGEAPGLALALVIPANSSATIGWVYYAAPTTGEAESLSAIAPPDGFKVVQDYYGTEDKTWSYTVSGTKTIWVAFYQGDAADTSNPSDLVIEVYNDVYQAGELPLRLDPGHVKYILYGKEGGYETKTFTASGVVAFSVKTYAKDWKTAWRVIVAVSQDQARPQPQPTQPQPVTETPRADLPERQQLVYAAAGAAAVLMLVVLASALGGRRR